MEQTACGHGVSDAAGHRPAEEGALRPVTRERARRAGLWGRVLAGLIAAGCLAVLTVAARLEPDPSGMGTHQQLGMARCGFLTSTGMPCMSCGMTTAFAAMAHFRPIDAVAAQPMGAVLYLAAAAAVVLLGITALTGHVWWSLYIHFYGQRFWFGVLTFWLASWVWKILAVGQMRMGS